MTNNIYKNMLHALITLLIFVFFGCSKTLQQPNIVFIMGDDIGIETIGSYGGTTYSTPNIDKLAENGIRFTNCYSSPVCSPSRVKLMTGRYGFRTGQKWGYIPPDEITFGHILKESGYKIALAGKWQMALLKEDPYHIKKMGFDKSSVFGWHEGPRYHNPLIYQNGKILDNVQDKYGPDIFCDFLIDFIKENKEKPFLAYFPMALAHEISNDLESPPFTAPDGKYQSYQELVNYMDIIVGRIIQTLDDLNLRENTVIIFTGDNGTPEKFITKYENGNYIKEPIYSVINGKTVKGGKSHLTDAGTHVPLIVNWQGVAPNGSVNNSLIDFSDFLPTLLDLAKADMPKNLVVDGRSFAPQIYGQEGNPRDWVYNEWEGKYWIRNHQWKLYNNGYLFDMGNDPLEKNPISEDNDSDHTKNIRIKFLSELKQLRYGFFD